MECVSVLEARYINDYRIWLKFNTGETGEVDLQDFMRQYVVFVEVEDERVRLNMNRMDEFQNYLLKTQG